jgi:uroporphyrin-3 C-methyltransferase
MNNDNPLAQQHIAAEPINQRSEPAARLYRGPSLFSKSALILGIIALFVLGWQWLNTRHRFNDVEKSLSRKLEEYQALNQQSLLLAKQAEERSLQANARTVILEQKLAESHDQQEILQGLYDQLAENREATTVAEVEQLLTIANQQLQLAGNVRSALLALQAADKRLQPLNLPRSTQLRETLAADIEKLRKVPQVDVYSLSAQLISLAALCDTLPLISESQPTLNAKVQEQKAQEQQNPLPKHLSNAQKIANSIWNDIKELVTIERIDKPEPPLLSPDHAFYLHENLKLHLLTARIALLQHDEATYRADIKTVTSWLNQYFDTKHPNTIKALSLLKKISAKDINIELPQLTGSLDAVNRYKLSLEDKGLQE